MGGGKAESGQLKKNLPRRNRGEDPAVDHGAPGTETVTA